MDYQIPSTHEQRKNRHPVQFGLMRTLVWLCPGFGVAATGAAMRSKLNQWVAEVPVLFYGGVALLALGLFVLFGILDAFLNPSLPKEDGRPRTGPMVRSLVVFALLQLLVAPVVFAFFVGVFGELMGWRI